MVGAGHLRPGGQNPAYDKPGGAHNSVLPIIGAPFCPGSESVGAVMGKLYYHILSAYLLV